MEYIYIYIYILLREPGSNPDAAHADVVVAAVLPTAVGETAQQKHILLMLRYARKCCRPCASCVLSQGIEEQQTASN